MAVRGGDPLRATHLQVGREDGAKAARSSNVVNLKYSDRLRRGLADRALCEGRCQGGAALTIAGGAL
jgi:hypothetical protein